MLHKPRLLACTDTERLPCDHRARCCIFRSPLFLSFIIFPYSLPINPFTMFLWPLAVGPICTAAVLAGAYLRWSQTTPLELWTMCRRLTKTFLFAVYISLIALWLGIAYLTRQLMNESQQNKFASFAVKPRTDRKQQ